jgi:hypothetical protein
VAGFSYALSTGRGARSDLVNNFVRALLLVQFLLFLGAEFGFPEINHNLIERAVELERHMVVFADRRAGVFAHIEGFERWFRPWKTSCALLMPIVPNKMAARTAVVATLDGFIIALDPLADIYREGPVWSLTNWGQVSRTRGTWAAEKGLILVSGSATP